MEDARRKEIHDFLKDISFEEKKQVFSEIINFGTFSGTDVYEKLILISLVSLVYIKTKRKNPKISALELLEKITKGEESSSHFQHMLESLALVVEELSYQCNTSNSFNMTDSKEIINKIKEILNTWVPF